MQCKHCGFANSPSDTRCQSCGKTLAGSSVQAGGRNASGKKCRFCGSEYQSAYCPSCGRWAGPTPRGIIMIVVMRIFGSTTGLLGSIAIILVVADSIVHASPSDMLFVLGIFACMTSLTSVLQFFFAVNLLRLRQWAYTAFRVFIVIGMGLSSISLLLLILGNPNPLELVQIVVEIIINIVILFYLRGKDYIFSSKAAEVSVPPKRRCAFCGNEKLTSFDTICPHCKKPPA
jgi:hypothetical protein